MRISRPHEIAYYIGTASISGKSNLAASRVSQWIDHVRQLNTSGSDLGQLNPQGWLAKVEPQGEFVALFESLRLACADRVEYGRWLVSNVLAEAEGAIESHRQLADAFEISPLSGLLALGGDPAIGRYFEKRESPFGETTYEPSSSESDLLEDLRNHPKLGVESAGLLREEVETTGALLADTVRVLEQAGGNLAQQISRAGGGRGE